MKRKKSKELRIAFWALMTAFAFLFVIGTVNVYSSTFVEEIGTGNTFGYLGRQAFLVFIGLFPGFFVYCRDYHWWSRHAGKLAVLTIILLLAVFAGGTVVNGARRWIGIGGVTFQPSELAKLTVIVCTATAITNKFSRRRAIEFLRPLHRERRKKGRARAAVLPTEELWLPILLSALVFKQPDAGTAGVIFLLPAMMLWASGAKLSQAKYPLLIAGVAGVILLLSAPYRMDRITAWLDPWSYEKTLGYQTVQGLIAIGSGGFFGQGLGEGISKFSYLPEAHTDFAFAVFAQEWGFIGALGILFLFGLIIYYGCYSACHSRDTFGTLLALGVTFYFGGQGFINIGMVSGMLPVVGVPLPFISYGGTSLIVNMTAAALLLNICRDGYRHAEQQERYGTVAAPKPMRQQLKLPAR